MKMPRIFRIVLACVFLTAICLCACAASAEEAASEVLEVWYGSSEAEVRGNFSDGVTIIFADMNDFAAVQQIADDEDVMVRIAKVGDEENRSYADDTFTGPVLDGFGLRDGLPVDPDSLGCEYIKLSRVKVNAEDGGSDVYPLTLCMEYYDQQNPETAGVLWTGKLVHDDTLPLCKTILVRMPGLDAELFRDDACAFLSAGLETLTGNLGAGATVTVKVGGEMSDSDMADSKNRFSLNLRRALEEEDEVEVEFAWPSGDVMTTAACSVAAMDNLTLQMDSQVREATAEAIVKGQSSAWIQWQLTSGEGSHAPETAQLSETGEFTISLTDLSQNTDYTLDVWYKGSSSERCADEKCTTGERAAFTVDGSCDFRLIDPENENAFLESEAAISEKTVSLTAVCGEQETDRVTVKVDGEKVEAAFEPADGGARMTIEVSPEVGQTLRISADDGRGNQVSYSLTVEKVTYAAIALTEPQFNQKGYYAPLPEDETIAFAGTAQPGQPVTFALTQGGETVAQEEVTPDSEGCWQLEVAHDKLTEGEPAALTLSYADGYMAEASQEVTFTLDGELPALTVEETEIVAGEEACLTGTTEPGATVTAVSSDDETSVSAVADENGAFSIDLSGFAADTALTAVAEDDAGNQSVPVSISVVAKRSLVGTLTLSGDDGVRTVGSQGECTLSGEAMKGETLTVSINGATVKSIPVEEDGLWQYVVEYAMLFKNTAEDVAVVTVAYESEPEVCQEARFEIDRECALTVLPVQEGDRQFTVTAEPGATVVISRNGVDVLEEVADESGVMTFASSEPIKVSDELTVAATDTLGNRAEVPVTIEKADGGEVPEITMDEIETGCYADGVTVTGSAQAGMTVNITVNGAAFPAETDAEGRFEVTVTGLAEGLNALTASYADFYADYKATITLINDTEAPEIALDQLKLTDDTKVLSGTVSEPATVSLLEDSAVIATAEADEAFSFEVSLQPGKFYDVQAVDAVGNERRFSFEAQEALRLLGDVEPLSNGGSFSYMESFEVSGWALVNGELTGVNLSVGGESIPMETADHSELLAEKATQYADQIDATGYATFRLSVDAGQLEMGENAMSVSALVNGETVELGQLSVRVVKPSGYLPKRVFLLAALLLGLIIAVSSWIHINRKIKALKSAAAEADQTARTMTVRERKN